MTGARWWTVFFVGTTAVVAIVVAVGHTPSTIGPVATWVALAVMLLAYLLIGRRALSDGRFGLPFSIILILGTGSAVAGSPNAAIFQAIAFPVLWSVIESVRWSVVANIALALSVAIGFLVCLGVTPGTVTQAATSRASPSSVASRWASG